MLDPVLGRIPATPANIVRAIRRHEAAWRTGDASDAAARRLAFQSTEWAAYAAFAARLATYVPTAAGPLLNRVVLDALGPRLIDD